jgi:pimeloyl-ACP methyl ester carboxylesterase
MDARLRTALHLAVCLLSFAIAGCVAGIEDLPREQRVRPAPRVTYHYPTRVGNGPVVHVAVHVTGRPDARRALVMVHGVFADSSCFRLMDAHLRDDYRLILVDLPGCGESDKPSPTGEGHDTYTVAALAEHVLQAMEQHMTTRPDDTVMTLVGHSLGGSVALRIAGSPALRDAHRRIVGNVDQLVLFAPAEVEITSVPEELGRCLRSRIGTSALPS